MKPKRYPIRSQFMELPTFNAMPGLHEGLLLLSSFMCGT